MTRGFVKPVSIIKEWIEKFQTSRTLQLAAIITTITLFVATVAVLTGWFILRHSDQVIASRPEPTPLHFQSVDDLQFIDSKTGKPLIWFFKTSTGYILYNGEGFHTDGTPLRPAKGSEITAIKTWVLEEMADHQHASLQSLFSFDEIPQKSAAVVVGIQTEALPTDLKDRFISQINTILKTNYTSNVFVSDAIQPDFFRKGYFDKAFSKDADFLNDVSFFSQANVLLLIKPEISFKDTTTVEGMKSAHINLTCRSYISGTTKTSVASFQSIGPGYSEEASLKNAIETLLETHRNDFGKLLTGDL